MTDAEAVRKLEYGLAWRYWDDPTRDAIRAVLAENERLRAQALSMTVYAQGQEARIDAALEVYERNSGDIDVEWLSIAEGMVKALKGEK